MQDSIVRFCSSNKFRVPMTTSTVTLFGKPFTVLRGSAISIVVPNKHVAATTAKVQTSYRRHQCGQQKVLSQERNEAQQDGFAEVAYLKHL